MKFADRILKLVRAESEGFLVLKSSENQIILIEIQKGKRNLKNLLKKPSVNRFKVYDFLPRNLKSFRPTRI